MSEGSLLFDFVNRHIDRIANRWIDINHKGLFLVTQKNGTSIGGGHDTFDRDDGRILIHDVIIALHPLLRKNFTFRYTLKMNLAQNVQPDKRNLFLIGMMGTGKSTIGKILAERTERKFIDSDAEIEKEQRTGIPEIFAKQGESVFRELEKKFITGLQTEEPTVVACGGGLCIPEGMMELLKSKGHVIGLMASAETLLDRTQGDRNRPLLQVAQPLQALAKLVEQRDHRYRQANTLIQTDHLSPEQVTEKIIEQVFN